jgi:hypothetical protein
MGAAGAGAGFGEGAVDGVKLHFSSSPSCTCLHSPRSREAAFSATVDHPPAPVLTSPCSLPLPAHAASLPPLICSW